MQLLYTIFSLVHTPLYATPQMEPSTIQPWYLLAHSPTRPDFPTSPYAGFRRLRDLVSQLGPAEEAILKDPPVQFAAQVIESVEIDRTRKETCLR